jgi:anhydro-N-acetylmuramic acid kinase
MSNSDIQHYSVIGLMSGTSLDGVDIAFCRFAFDNNGWTYNIIEAETIAYTAEWKQALSNLEKTDAFTFQQTHVEYGFYLGKLVSDFIKKYNLNVDFVSSHGHTIFHQPEKKLTVQIGAGSAIAAECSLPVVCDFRSLDVALGGQGAPLVPIGDKLLFAEYDFCLNLGGFANVSYNLPSPYGEGEPVLSVVEGGVRCAFDICPVNIVMNAVCATLEKEYDNEGELARKGIVNESLLQELNQIRFYQLPANSPKSLGKEWVIKNINPLFKKYNLPPTDILRTFCEHISVQVTNALNVQHVGKILVTGGGAFNTFLIECIKKQSVHQLIIPAKKTIEFKEALIFAFLGVLRMRNEINCLKSVTGAKHDNIGGAIYIN